MKILLVCAGGMSTSILMKKMEKYWNDQGQDLTIKAVGMSE
ncbi:PTS sugar transporter subunit IIB, partial [Streptococcus suis]